MGESDDENEGGDEGEEEEEDGDEDVDEEEVERDEEVEPRRRARRPFFYKAVEEVLEISVRAVSMSALNSKKAILGVGLRG